MSNIFRTAEVQRLVTPRKERIAEAYEAFQRMAEELKGDDPIDPDRLIETIVVNMSDLIEKVETLLQPDVGHRQRHPPVRPRDRPPRTASTASACTCCGESCATGT